jgi:Holliday junction resolvase RusA-like endonuclease
METNPRILPMEHILDDCHTEDSVGRVMGVYFTIHQKPIPMPRPSATFTRTGMRFYSPVKTKGSAFAVEAKRLIQLTYTGKPFPMFKDGDTARDQVSLHVKITYRIRRPNDHFEASNRSKPVKRSKLLARVTGGDLDNLVKYTLDCMNSMVYFDDKMITSLATKKVWNQDPNSDGNTSVEVQKDYIWI